MESVKLPPLKDQVAGALRQEIFARHLEDGQELAQEEIARTLGVSRIPVREAFLKIAAAEPERVRVVDADRAPELVHAEIGKIVHEAL